MSSGPDAAGNIPKREVDTANDTRGTTGINYDGSASSGETRQSCNRLATDFGGGTGTNVPAFSLTYNFNLGNSDNGNVVGITKNRDTAWSQTFTYDTLNRIISAQNAGSNCSATTMNGGTEYWGNSYVYDAWGNLLRKNVTKCSADHLNVTAFVSFAAKSF